MGKRFYIFGAVFFTIAFCLAGCDLSTAPSPAQETNIFPDRSEELLRPVLETAPASPVVTAARSQIGRTIIYDPAYVGLAYPGGDIPIERGVCTDVVIRALRDALKLDLQKLVHEDMSAAFSKYPSIWGLKKPDRNIDHRRVPNLMKYFERRGWFIGITNNKADYLPGDIITCTVGRNLAHIMIVSERAGPSGDPLVIHNIGSGTVEEDRLFAFALTGHYRISNRALLYD